MQRLKNTFAQRGEVPLDLFSGMRFFSRVVETGSFSVCAREFGLTPSSVTRSITALEDHLGIELLHRTTRKVIPTEAGRAYYKRAKRLLFDFDEASSEAAGLGTNPKGVLRITAPIGLGELRLAPLLPKFFTRFPQIQVDLHLSDEYVDLMAESIDVALRAGIHKDSSFRARKLEDYRRVLCGSPAYLSKNGTPKKIDDLARHSCLTYNFGAESKYWYFKTGGKIREVPVQGHLHVNSLETILAAVKGGTGLCLLPSWSVVNDIRSGELVEVLPNIKGNISPAFDESLYAVYLGQKPPPKIRVFVDFLVEEFKVK
jgi:DNA-binding transcriptional LysR family regulator